MITPILQMRKMEVRKVKGFAKGLEQGNAGEGLERALTQTALLTWHYLVLSLASNLLITVLRFYMCFLFLPVYLLGASCAPGVC